MARRGGFYAVLMLWLSLASIAPIARAEEPKKPTEDDYELYQIFADTLDQVERNYVKDVSRRELMEAAIQGVLGKLDPYSNYISPDDIGRFKTTVESQFGGIGIQVGVENGRLKIISPLVGTPAYRAGLEAGDVILEIDGKSTEGILIDQAVKQLKGEAGTNVTLTVQHVHSPKRETVTITREWVHVETVLGDHRNSDDAWDFMLDHDKRIGYVRIAAFSRDTAQDLKKALVELKNQGLKGLIVDLRFNPGGLLTSAIEVSDLFLADGRIVSTKGRNTPERTWEAEQEGTFEGFPMAVLVNHYSASASEILSACLQDHKRAVVIGERTWGKGSVQNVIELEGGKSALKLTTASYYRPSGKNIHRFPDSKESDEWGVMPDPGFELTLNMRQTERLIRDRRERDILVAKRKAAADAAAAAEPAEGGQPKTEEPKPDSAKPDQRKDADAKSEEPKSEDAKPAESKSDEPKSDAPKSDEPKSDVPKSDAPKSDDPNSDAPAKPEGSKPAEPTDDKAKDAGSSSVVDPQLQKAIDYLTQELARAQ
jgi:carboxyl-terminal processing protease